MSQDPRPAHAGDSSPVTGGGFYRRLLVALVVIVGGIILGVWYANRQ